MTTNSTFSVIDEQRDHICFFGGETVGKQILGIAEFRRCEQNVRLCCIRNRRIIFECARNFCLLFSC